METRAFGEEPVVLEPRRDLRTLDLLRDALHCRAARPVATFDDRVVAELVVVAPHRQDVQDLARVQYVEGRGEATTSWRVAEPVPGAQLSLVLQAQVRTPAACDFAVRLSVTSPLAWQVYRSALRRATDLVLRFDPETGWGLISLPAPPDFARVAGEVERLLETETEV